MLSTILETAREVVDNPGIIAKWVEDSEQIKKLSDSEVDLLLTNIHQLHGELVARGADTGEPANEHVFQQVVQQLIFREGSSDNLTWSPDRLETIQTWYSALPKSSLIRNLLLCWLAQSNQQTTLELWTDLVCEQPPENSADSVVFGPLMHKNMTVDMEWLQRLFERGMGNLQIAPAILELCNFYFRNKIVSVHPATSRSLQLVELQGQLIGQLGRIEEGNVADSVDPKSIGQQVTDSVAMIIALSDFFGLTNCEAAIGKLHQALALRHRRVQTEAAATLAKLGDSDGEAALVKLAEEPVARLRVLAFAEELGILKKISLEFQGEIARAESELAIWLAEPAQMGLAPSKIEVIDNRELFWPGFEHPIQCYIFRFQYGSDEKSFSNNAICGPLVHAFEADIKHLSTDDAFAAFAGWQTVHDEIFSLTQQRAETAFPNEWRKLKSDLAADESISSPELMAGGRFFGDLALIAAGEVDGQPGTVIIDSVDRQFIPAGNPDSPIDWQLAYCIWKGRRLLRTFNSA